MPMLNNVPKTMTSGASFINSSIAGREILARSRPGAPLRVAAVLLQGLVLCRFLCVIRGRVINGRGFQIDATIDDDLPHCPDQRDAEKHDTDNSFRREAHHPEGIAKQEIEILGEAHVSYLAGPTIIIPRHISVKRWKINEIHWLRVSKNERYSLFENSGAVGVAREGARHNTFLMLHHHETTG